MRILGMIGLVLALASGAAAAAGPETARDSFIATLSDQERAAAFAAFDDPDRRRARLTPGRRGGLRLDAMDAETRAAAFALLDAALSADGRAMVDTLIAREAELGELTGAADYRDPEKYYLAVFGADARWAFRFEGHHLSLNMTYDGDSAVSITPLLLGANPEVSPASGEPVFSPLADIAAQGDAAGVLEGVLRLFRSVDQVAVREAMSGAELSAAGQDVALAAPGGVLRLQWQAANHIHLVLQLSAADFGGS